MKTFKVLIKTSFFNQNNDFLCFDIIKYIFNRRSNEVFIDRYMLKYYITIATNQWDTCNMSRLLKLQSRQYDAYFQNTVNQKLLCESLKCKLNVTILLLRSPTLSSSTHLQGGLLQFDPFVSHRIKAKT